MCRVGLRLGSIASCGERACRPRTLCVRTRWPWLSPGSTLPHGTYRIFLCRFSSIADGRLGRITRICGSAPNPLGSGSHFWPTSPSPILNYYYKAVIAINNLSLPFLYNKKTQNKIIKGPDYLSISSSTPLSLSAY